MPYSETKVYFDGSHYIAIPHTTKPYKPRPKRVEEVIEVQNDTLSSEENMSETQEETVVNADMGTTEEIEPAPEQSLELVVDEETGEVLSAKPKNTRTMTRKQLFEELYKQTVDLKPKARTRKIVEEMLPYFKSKRQTEKYVEAQFDRIHRNFVCRRIRLSRKVNLQEFNYFCTFTYDDALHTEESFKKKLQGCFKMMCHRRGWKYIGVWERVPETHRLHFHGIFYIPEGQMVGELIKVKDYNTTRRKMQETVQNTYFNERFGRSDFEEIYDRVSLGSAVEYILKYIKKTGEKVVYSRGLPQYFISDILDDDVVCPTGIEENKLLLFDDFLCIDGGEIIGKVSKETIAKMRKCNQ